MTLPPQTTPSSLSAKQAAIEIWTINSLDQWTEWSHGKLNQLDIGRLFEAVAKSYEIPNDPSLGVVEFHLIDSKSKSTVLFLHRDVTENLNQAIEEIGKVAESQLHHGDFRVCILPAEEEAWNIEW